MVGKKALRLATAGLLAVTAAGAQQFTGASTHQASAATNVVSITDWQFPDGCGVGASSVANTEVCAELLISAFNIDNHLNYIPELWQSRPTLQNGGAKVVGGNLVVTYKLRPNLRWSDGSPETASDFIFGTKLEIAVGNSFGIDQIKSMQAINGGAAIRVTYKGLYAPYFESGEPTPLPRAYLQKKYGTSNIDAMAAKFSTDTYNSPSDVWNGAYKVQSWVNGQSIVLVPNPYYHGLPPANGHPLPIVKFVNISQDEAGLATALQSSNAGVDKAEDFQANDLPVLNSSKYKITAQPALFVEHLELNQSGPLKDIRLRQALQYAVDKKALFKALFPTITNPSNFLLGSVLPGISSWRNKSIGVSPYNPAKARALVREAGYSSEYGGSGRHLLLHFATTRATIRQKDFQILSRYWAAVGIHVSPTFASGSPSANGGMFSPYNLNGVLVQRHFDIALFAFQEPPDPASIETSFDPSMIPTTAANHHSASDQNYNGIRDADQWSLLVRAHHALDVAQRHAYYDQWQKLVDSRAYWIMLYARQNITADNGTIGNYKPNPASSGNDWNMFQWYKAAQ